MTSSTKIILKCVKNFLKLLFSFVLFWTCSSSTEMSLGTANMKYCVAAIATMESFWLLDYLMAQLRFLLVYFLEKEQPRIIFRCVDICRSNFMEFFPDLVKNAV